MEVTSKRRVDRLVMDGRYGDAARAIERNQDIKAARQLELQKQLEEAQSIQWQAFNRSKAQYFMNTEVAAAADQEAKGMSLSQKIIDDRMAHEEELEAFATREETVLMRRPVALSTNIVSMRREEKRLGLKGRFAEAEAMREAASRLEVAEERAAVEEKQRLLQDKVLARKKLLLDKEHISYKNSRAKMLLDDLHAERSMVCTTAKLGHMETDMAAMHARQRRELKKLGYIPRISDAQLCKAERGTLLQERVFGDKYTIPSLCELYGPLLDWESAPVREPY